MTLITLTFKKGTTAEWAAKNPVLADGEPGVEITAAGVRLLKIGDSVTPWNALAYITGGVTSSSVNTVNPSGAAVNIPEPSVASITVLVLNNAACALTFPTAAPGKKFTVALQQDGTGGRGVTWPNNVEWSGGTQPTLSSSPTLTDVVEFTCYDGINWYGVTKGFGFQSLAPVNTGTPSVTIQAPVNTAAPAITGTATIGSTLTVSNGSWSNSPTSYTYQWQHYDGTSWSNISSATASTYAIQSSDTSDTIRCVVTATNAGGSTAANSNATSAVPAPPSAPANTAAPAVTGTATQGQTLTTTNGAWSGSPTGYAYQWQRYNGTSWANISGATSSTYVLAAADVGDTIRCVVTATNANGSTSANSNSTATVAASGGGAITRIGDIGFMDDGYNTTHQVNITQAVPAGSLIALYVVSPYGSGGGAAPATFLTSVTDSKGNTYAIDPAAHAYLDYGGVAIVWAVTTVALTTSDYLTITPTGGSSLLAYAEAYSGMTAVKDVMVAANEGGYGTAWAGGAVTTTNAKDLILNATVSNTPTADTPSTGYTDSKVALGSNCTRTILAQRRILAATGTYTPGGVFNAADNAASITLALKGS